MCRIANARSFGYAGIILHFFATTPNHTEPQTMHMPHIAIMLTLLLTDGITEVNTFKNLSLIDNVLVYVMHLNPFILHERFYMEMF